MTYQGITKCLRPNLNAARKFSFLFRTFGTSLDDPSSTLVSKTPDPVLLAIKSAPSTIDILRIAGIHCKHMEPIHVVHSFSALYRMEKLSKLQTPNVDLLTSNEFILLCKALKKHIRSMSLNDVIVALKTVTYLGMNCKSATVQNLLYILKNDLNDLSIAQIIFLTFLLRQYPKDPVVDALKIALPIIFEAQLVMKLDRKNVRLLVDALIYCTKNRISNTTLDIIITALNELDQLEWLTMDFYRAKNIVISVCDLDVGSTFLPNLFNNAIKIIIESLNQLNFTEIDHLLTAITNNIRKKPYLYNEEFFTAIGETAIKSNFSLKQCCILLRKLNKLGAVNRNMLNYMGNKILENPEEFRDAPFSTLKSFVGGLSVADYKTNYWNVIKDIIPSTKCFQMVNSKQPWLSFCGDLASLDVYCDGVLKEVFSDSFLRLHLSRENNLLDLLQLLRLYQAVSALHPKYNGPWPPEHMLQEAIDINGRNVATFPLQKIVEQSMGGENYVLTPCFADHGHFIDHVIVLRSGGHAIAFPEAKAMEKIYLNNLNVPENSTRVGIRFLPNSCYNGLKQLKGFAVLTQRILESQGLVVVNISQSKWDLTPDWEKIPYLMQYIRQHLPDYQKQMLE